MRRSAMRYGFFYGVAGDAAALESVLERLADCDRVVSLGDLVGPARAGDDSCLQWMMARGADPRFLLLAGKAERLRSRDGQVDEATRLRLRQLPSVAILDGVALVGAAHATGPAGRSSSEPPLIARLTVAAGPAGSRFWRSIGGLARVEEIGAPARLDLDCQKVRLDVGARGTGGATVAILDTGAGTLELREAGSPHGLSALPSAHRRPQRVRRSHEGQQLLAV